MMELIVFSKIICPNTYNKTKKTKIKHIRTKRKNIHIGCTTFKLTKNVDVISIIIPTITDFVVAAKT